MKRVLINISFICLILFSMNEIEAQVPKQDNTESKVLLYPNPTAGPLHIDFISESRVKPSAKILDITGKVVQSGVVKGQSKNQISFSRTIIGTVTEHEFRVYKLGYCWR